MTDIKIMIDIKIKNHKKKCKNCGLVFIYTVNDVRRVRDMITDETVGLTVICPECGEEYWIV